ncbi:MAG: amidohydrolase [Gammaproteobacteria bacterium]|nr:amidohydrolase [Gammaproteobacteria bacterium]
MKLRYLFAALVMLLAGCGKSPQSTSPEPAAQADAIYRNARIYTVDSNDSWAEAMAVRDGRIVAVGSDAVVKGLAGEQTVLHDLAGRMVMPGIHDTHIHPSDAGVQKQLECSFLSNDLDEVLDILKGCIAETPEGDWVRGGQWNEGLFASGKTPKTILDEIAPDHPVFLMDWSVHNAWVNTRALEIFGIDNDTPDPPGGVIVRDPDSGEATGILLDNAAYDNRRILPVFSLDERADALAWAINQIAQHGITTYKEALVTAAAMEAYAELDDRDALPLRVKTNLTWKSSWANSHDEELALIAARDDFVSERIKTDFAKIMLDGIPPTYTAALLEPYAPSEAHGANHRGKLMFQPDELNADVIALDRQGLSVKIHATGDRSARVALDAFEAAREANGNYDLVHEVSHAEIIHADDIPRFKELNVAAEMCPILWYPIPGLDWELWLGPERAKVWPVKTLTESGALVIYGSDWPVVPTPNPWTGIEAMVTRSDPAGPGDEPDWPEQAVDLATALRIFTINGAIANKAGDESGSLEVGKAADFIVLDRNIFDVPITDVGETQVELVVVNGTPVIDKL